MATTCGFGPASRFSKASRPYPTSTSDGLGSLLERRQERWPLLRQRAPCRTEQPGRHQQREQVQGVIDRSRLQVPRHRHQSRGPLRFAKPRQGRGLAAQPDPSQHLQPVGRDIGHVDPASTQARHLLGSLQCLDHLRPRATGRRQPQPFQVSTRATRPGPSATAPAGLAAADQPCRPTGTAPHTTSSRPPPSPSRPAGQHAHPGQQPVAAQPRHRMIERGHRPLRVRPRPPGRELFERVLGKPVEGPVAVPVADLPHTCSYTVCGRCTYCFTHDASPMPSCSAKNSTATHGMQRILQEAAHRPHRAQLHRETQSWWSTGPRDQVPVRTIEVENRSTSAREGTPPKHP